MLPGGVEQWVCHPILHLTLFRHLTWCMLATPTPHRHRRACFFVRHQLGRLSKRIRRSKLNPRHPLPSNVTSHCLMKGLENLVCQLQRVTSCWQTHLRYPACPEQWVETKTLGNDTALSVSILHFHKKCPSHSEPEGQSCHSRCKSSMVFCSNYCPSYFGVACDILSVTDVY